MDGSWLIQAYPGAASEFSAFDGTRLQCQGTAASGTITAAGFIEIDFAHSGRTTVINY